MGGKESDPKKEIYGDRHICLTRKHISLALNNDMQNLYL
jgi:hypothetical protein